MSHYGKANLTFADGDFDEDGVCSFIDFQTWELSFGKTLPAAAAETIAPVAPKPVATRPVAPPRRPAPTAAGQTAGTPFARLSQPGRGMT